MGLPFVCGLEYLTMILKTSDCTLQPHHNRGQYLSMTKGGKRRETILYLGTGRLDERGRGE